MILRNSQEGPYEQAPTILKRSHHRSGKILLSGDVPVGCVIVLRDQIIARAHNLREAHHDPTAHAEIIALREAGKALGSWQLKDCDLYVTHEPCPMCAGALVMARIHTLYYGCDEPTTGACGSCLNLVQFPGFPHNVHIVGPLAQENAPH